MFGSRKKLNWQDSYFHATTTKPFDQVKMKLVEVKDVRWRIGRWRRNMLSSEDDVEEVTEGFVEEGDGE